MKILGDGRSSRIRGNGRYTNIGDTIEKDLMLFWEEYTAGGLEGKALTPAAKEVLDEAEDYIVGDRSIPDALLDKWSSLFRDDRS